MGRSLSWKQRSWKESIETKVSLVKPAGQSGSLPSHTVSATTPSICAPSLTQEQKDRIANNRRAALEKKWHIHNVCAAGRQGKLNSWEISFYEDVFLKAVQGIDLSDKQRLHRDRIFQKVIGGA